MILEGGYNFFLDIEKSRLAEITREDGPVKNSSSFGEQPLESKNGRLLYDGEEMQAMSRERIKERVTEWLLNHDRGEAVYFGENILKAMQKDLSEKYSKLLRGELKEEEQDECLKEIAALWMEGKEDRRLMAYLDGQLYNEIYLKR